MERIIFHPLYLQDHRASYDIQMILFCKSGLRLNRDLVDLVGSPPFTNPPRRTCFRNLRAIRIVPGKKPLVFLRSVG